MTVGDADAGTTFGGGIAVITGAGAGIGAGLFSTAGLLAVSGWLALIAGAVAALALMLPVWAAAMIVAAVLFVAAAVAAMIGKKQLAQAPAAADEVVSSVSADVDAVRGR